RLARPNDDVFPHWNLPPHRETTTDQRTLIIATLAFSRCCQRDRNKRGALFDHVRRPTQTAYSARQLLGNDGPSLVLQRVDDAPGRVEGHPAHGSDSADERRQQLAPAAV